MTRLSLRLTHKIMAIGLIGLLGLCAFGLINYLGNSSQDVSRLKTALRRGLFLS